MASTYEILSSVKDPGPRPADPGPEPVRSDAASYIDQAVAHRQWHQAVRCLDEWLDARRLFLLAEGARKLSDAKVGGDPLFEVLRNTVVLLVMDVVRREAAPKDPFSMMGLTD